MLETLSWVYENEKEWKNKYLTFGISWTKCDFKSFIYIKFFTIMLKLKINIEFDIFSYDANSVTFLLAL